MSCGFKLNRHLKTCIGWPDFLKLKLSLAYNFETHYGLGQLGKFFNKPYHHYTTVFNLVYNLFIFSLINYFFVQL